MSDPNIYLDGTGNFNALTKNAGTIKYGTFNNAASNTGVIAVSAIFTGTAVNSGVIGNILPINTANLVASNSAAWDSTYYTVSALSAEWSAGGGGGGGGAADLTAISDVSATWDAAFTFVSLNSSILVDTNDTRLSDARTPIAHTQAISTIDGLQAELDAKQASGSYAAAAHAHAIADVTDLQSNINNLSSAIDGKQVSGSYASATDARITLVGTNSANWNNSYTTLTANSATWSAKANASHTHAISDVTNLQTSLDAKASSTDARITLVGTNSARWNSSYSTLTATSATWSAKANASHTHTSADVTDFNTAADARIAAAAGVSIASLVGGTIPSAQLPSYVDDVLEYTSTATFPATGSAGIIYVAIGTNKTYRWSGSAYVEISPSPGSTDSVTEGSVNLYFTDARATAALQTTVNSLSSAIDGKQTSGSYASATDARITLVETNSANWNNSYTTLTTNSATWNAASTSTPSFNSLTTAELTLSSGMLSTFTAPVTASGDFIVITVGTKKRLIRLWDNT